MTEEQYIQKGFNAGYQLEKHDPELSKTLQAGFTDKEHPYTVGFVAGSQEWQKELVQTQNRPSLLSQYENPSPNENTLPSQEKDNEMER